MIAAAGSAILSSIVESLHQKKGKRGRGKKKSGRNTCDSPCDGPAIRPLHAINRCSGEEREGKDSSNLRPNGSRINLFHVGI